MNKVYNHVYEDYETSSIHAVRLLECGHAVGG